MKIIITLLLFTSFVSLNAQTAHEIALQQWQEELNATFRDTDQSPLDKKAIKKFKSLDYYPINKKYCLKAKFLRTPNELPFAMPTSTGQNPIYEKYGELLFSIDDQPYKLAVYQNHSLRLNEEYADYLFLPFTDQTNGPETYGGGRYLDLRIPETDSLVLDFNKAYNPSCAYNGNYSCPIPPRENDLPIKIMAGVLKWDQ